MLSRWYTEDVDVEVQCEGMIRTDKIKTHNIKIPGVKSSNLKAYTIIRHSHELLLNH